MELSFSLDSIITIFVTGGAVLGSSFLGFILIFRTQRTRSNIFLGILLILGGLTILNNLFAHAGIYSRYQHLYFIPLYYTLSFGPLTYFYVATKLTPGYRFKRVDIIHAILPLAQAFFYFSIGFRDAEFKSWLWQNVIGPWYQDTEALLFVITFLIYTFSAANMVQKEENLLQPGWKQNQRKWLLKFLNVFVILVGVEFFYWILDTVFWNYLEINIYNIEWASFPLDVSKACVWYWVAFNGFQNAYPESLSVTPIPDKKREERYNLDAEDVDSALNKLDEYFRSERPYLNPDINLSMIAGEIGLTANKLSFVINEGKKMSFNEFINKHRIEEVKRKLSDEQFAHYTILSIALDSGFNSKATFNRVFKSSTGLTPRQYLESQ